MSISENLYINFSSEPALLKHLEKLTDITSTDFWLRPFDNMQLHWAVIHEVSKEDFKVVFFIGNSTVIDELVFESLIDAEKSLTRFCFEIWNYRDKESKESMPKPELPLFIDRKHPFPVTKLYSSHEYSKNSIVETPPSKYSTVFSEVDVLSAIFDKSFEQKLAKKFNVLGYFYKHTTNKYRKCLDIKRKGCSATTPELMIVMMNPGKSKPLNGVYDNIKPTEAVVDKTLEQILRVMFITSLSYVRVLNLSDIRMPKSPEFFKFLNSPESKGFPHSIFDPRRKEELAELLIFDVPIIYAWGVNDNKKLRGLADLAIKTINESNPVGLKKEGTANAYYHPLPHSSVGQKDWVKTIAGMLKEQHNLPPWR